MNAPRQPVLPQPPVIARSPIILSRRSRYRRSAHEAMTGEAVCHCEWRVDGLFFHTRQGELLVPLSEVSAFWLRSGWLWTLSGKLPVYEVQIEDKHLPEWRFMFELAWLHLVGTTAIQDLRKALSVANPVASIVPPPDDRGLLARLVSDFFS